MTAPWEPDEALAAFAELDHDRAARRGYPEAVYREGKTPAPLAAIAGEVGDSGQPALFTRAGAAQARAVLDRLPGARHHEDARLAAWLPSVVAGLVPAPAVAVPTSAGYGASFGGIAALLAMLNARAAFFRLPALALRRACPRGELCERDEEG